jgi:hypothetical protein
MEYTQMIADWSIVIDLDLKNLCKSAEKSALICGKIKKNLPQIFADGVHADDRRLEYCYRFRFKKSV